MKKFLLIITIVITSTTASLRAQSAASTDTAKDIARLPGFEAAAQKEQKGPGIGKGPWEIGDIVVKGAKNVKPKVIAKTGKAKKGALYYQDFVNSDIEAIVGLGSIDTVSVDIEPLPNTRTREKFTESVSSSNTVVVTYLVAEKLMIKEIKIAGNKELSRGTVKDEMSLKEKDFFDELKIRADLIKITDKYHEKGFIDANTDYSIYTDTGAHTCVLTITVVEGKKAKIAGVTIDGAAGFKIRKLVGKMKNKPKKIYAPQELENDISELITFYKNNGYSECEVTGSSVTFNADKSQVFVKIFITEGARQYFGATTFSGNAVYTSKDLAVLTEYKRGKLFNQEKFDDTIRALQDKYADKGYLKAVIKPAKTPNSATQQLDIDFTIIENQPVYVGNIDVSGNKATKTYVLSREIMQKEGEVFSSGKIRRSQEKLMNLGFLDDVGIAVNPTQDPDKVDLVFDVTEGKPGMLTAGAGISSRDGLVGTLSMQHMNLLGRAYRTALSWSFGKRVQDYNLSWSTPWLGDSPTSLGFDLFNTRHYRPYQNSMSAYTERRTGGKVTVGPRFQNDTYHLTTSYTLEKIRISQVDQLYTGQLQEGTSVTSSVYLELARDTRDNIWDPTRGSKASLGIDFTGGPLMGDVNYYKPNASYSHNFKLFTIDDYPFVLALSNKFGYGGAFGKTTQLPVYERYFIGGADTVRGYNNNGQIGPLNGGNLYDVFNLEFHFPLAREKKRTIVQWAFFMDVGNSWDKFRDVRFTTGSALNQFKVGAGFGIRFTTPAFPIRLDWGYGFNHKDGEKRSDIYFTMGNLF